MGYDNASLVHVVARRGAREPRREFNKMRERRRGSGKARRVMAERGPASNTIYGARQGMWRGKPSSCGACGTSDGRMSLGDWRECAARVRVRAPVSPGNGWTKEFGWPACGSTLHREELWDLAWEAVGQADQSIGNREPLVLGSVRGEKNRRVCLAPCSELGGKRWEIHCAFLEAMLA